MPSGADRRLVLGAALALACACAGRPAQSENPYAELPAPEPEPDTDARVQALEERADAASERAGAIAEEAERQSKLPACRCDGAQACRVRCEPPNEPRCDCEVPTCGCVEGSDGER